MSGGVKTAPVWFSLLLRLEGGRSGVRTRDRVRHQDMRIVPAGIAWNGLGHGLRETFAARAARINSDVHHSVQGGSFSGSRNLK